MTVADEEDIDDETFEEMSSMVQVITGNSIDSCLLRRMYARAGASVGAWDADEGSWDEWAALDFNDAKDVIRHGLQYKRHRKFPHRWTQDQREALMYLRSAILCRDFDRFADWPWCEETVEQAEAAQAEYERRRAGRGGNPAK